MYPSYIGVPFLAVHSEDMLQMTDQIPLPNGFLSYFLLRCGSDSSIGIALTITAKGSGFDSRDGHIFIHLRKSLLVIYLPISLYIY